MFKKRTQITRVQKEKTMRSEWLYQMAPQDTTLKWKKNRKRYWISEFMQQTHNRFMPATVAENPYETWLGKCTMG